MSPVHPLLYHDGSLFVAHWLVNACRSLLLTLPPSDKSVFSHRIAMLHPSLAAGKRCRVVVLTTDENKEQSVWLEQLLTRMKLDCPAVLRHLAEQKNVVS